ILADGHGLTVNARRRGLCPRVQDEGQAHDGEEGQEGDDHEEDDPGPARRSIGLMCTQHERLLLGEGSGSPGARKGRTRAYRPPSSTTQSLSSMTFLDYMSWMSVTCRV